MGQICVILNPQRNHSKDNELAPRRALNTFVSSFSAFCLWKKLRFVTFWKHQSYEKREKKLADRISWIREVINIQHVLSASKFYVQLLSLSLFNNVPAWQLNFNLKFFSHSCSWLAGNLSVKGHGSWAVALSQKVAVCVWSLTTWEKSGACLMAEPRSVKITERNGPNVRKPREMIQLIKKMKTERFLQAAD